MGNERDSSKESLTGVSYSSKKLWGGKGKVKGVLGTRGLPEHREHPCQQTLPAFKSKGKACHHTIGEHPPHNPPSVGRLRRYVSKRPIPRGAQKKF